MKKSFLVAEVAQAHEGSVNLAISFIDLVKKAGYDAIKFQIHLNYRLPQILFKDSQEGVLLEMKTKVV